MGDREPVEELTLLVVEDDDRTRKELEHILSRRTDLKVLTAAEPSKALSLPAPDLALLDVRLPGMSGLELLERLRAANPDLLALVMTGFGEDATAREAREHGAMDFLEKPLDLPYLLVTLRQQAREARLRKSMRHSGALFMGVVESIPDGIVLCDRTGAVLYGNALGKALHATGAPTPGVSVEFGKRTYRAELAESGDRVLWRWADLTQALEEERLRSYRLLARLMAHELHNPLTPMRLWLQELQALPPEGPEVRRALEEAVPVLLDQVDRLGRLSARFRDLAEDRPLEAIPVDLVTAVGGAVRVLSAQAARMGVEIRVDLQPGLQATADEGALHQLFLNLLSNAVDAQAGRPGAVILQSAVSGGSVSVQISDKGGGLPPEVSAAPFTPYLTTKSGGTGLGLVVCRELARRMGGELSLEDSPGVGLTAVLRLPLA